MSWGGDVDAMAHLGDRLDRAARNLGDAARVIGSAMVEDGTTCLASGPTAAPVVAEMAAWASLQAADVRRRARILTNADAERHQRLQERIDHSDYDPHPGFFGH